MKKPRSLLEKRGFNNQAMVPSYMGISLQLVISGHTCGALIIMIYRRMLLWNVRSNGKCFRKAADFTWT